MVEDGLYCCNKLLSGEDGVNDSLFFKCERCGKCYNVTYSNEEVEERDEIADLIEDTLNDEQDR